MKKMIYVLCMGLVFVFYSNRAFAESKVVSLVVEGMMLPSCPVLLKKAVSKIDGVRHVDASLENKSATIEFDEAQTSLEQIQDTIESQVGFRTELK